MNACRSTLFAAALCCSTFAVAGSITLQWDATPWNPNPAAGPFGYSVTTGGSTYTGSVAPDRYHGTITAVNGVDPSTIGQGLPSVPEGLFTFCYELTQYFYTGETVVYEVVPATTPGSVTAYTLDFLGAVNAYLGGGATAWLTPSSPAMTANLAAAIQLGIWETLYDVGNPFDIANDANRGNFYLTSGQLGTGAGSIGGYLTTITGMMAATADLSPNAVARLSNTSDPRQNGQGAQDQITAVFPTSRLTVPEPGTLALLAITGFVALAVRRRSKA